jgi:hypothetical protein
MVVHFGRLFVLGFYVFLFLLQPVNGAVSDSQHSQIDVTIIHVDKYGVYGPKLVFYWDAGMAKKKIDALMKTAESLRNKKATVTYSASGDLAKDKRPLLVDIVAAGEGLRRASEEESRFSTTDENKSRGKEETRPTSKEDGKLASKGAATVEEPEELSSAKEKPADASFKDDRRRTAKESVVDDPSSRMSASHGEQKPAFFPSHGTAVTRDEIHEFIQKLLRLNESKDLNSVMLYYADRVDYYDRGAVTRDYIKRDMGYYFKNWNTISSILESDPVLIVTDQQDERIVKFISRYAVENARKSVSGRVENIWKIQKINNQLKIVDQKQRILSSETR